MKQFFALLVMFVAINTYSSEKIKIEIGNFHFPQIHSISSSEYVTINSMDEFLAPQENKDLFSEPNRKLTTYFNESGYDLGHPDFIPTEEGIVNIDYPEQNQFLGYFNFQFENVIDGSSSNGKLADIRFLIGGEIVKRTETQLHLLVEGYASTGFVDISDPLRYPIHMYFMSEILVGKTIVINLPKKKVCNKHKSTDSPLSKLIKNDIFKIQKSL